MSEDTPGVEGADEPPARRTPYELVFPEEFEGRIFPGILEEAKSHGVDPRHPERFAFLSLAGDAVRGVLDPDAPPDALEQYRALIFQAFNFWRYGKRIYVLEPALSRYLVEGAPSLEGWEFSLPHPTVYLQLPRNLFWGSISPESTPEPIDGLFATETEGEDALGRPYRRLEVLVVLGIRRDRAGFSVIPFSAETGPGVAAVWADSPGRDEGSDFANILPGGEIQGLYSILTTAEVLKIAGRALWYIDRYPEDVTLEAAPERRVEGVGGGPPPPPRLPYHRVGLGHREAED